MKKCKETGSAEVLQNKTAAAPNSSHISMEGLSTEEEELWVSLMCSRMISGCWEMRVRRPWHWLSRELWLSHLC